MIRGNKLCIAHYTNTYACQCLLSDCFDTSISVALNFLVAIFSVGSLKLITDVV